MSMSTTYRQAELLRFLAEYIAEHDGIAPSFTEMMEAVGAASKSVVYHLLDALEERGKIARVKNRSRCIRILPDDIFDGIPTHLLIAELARRGEEAGARRKAA